MPGYYKRKLTLEKVEQICELLRNPSHTLSSATLAVGLMPHVTKMLLQRLNAGGHELSEEDFDYALAIADAQAEQHRSLREQALACSVEERKATAHLQWRLESESEDHKRVTRTELTGSEGGPVELQNLSLTELLKLRDGAGG